MVCYTTEHVDVNTVKSWGWSLNPLNTALHWTTSRERQSFRDQPMELWTDCVLWWLWRDGVTVPRWTTTADWHRHLIPRIPCDDRLRVTSFLLILRDWRGVNWSGQRSRPPRFSGRWRVARCMTVAAVANRTPANWHIANIESLAWPRYQTYFNTDYAKNDWISIAHVTLWNQTRSSQTAEMKSVNANLCVSGVMCTSRTASKKSELKLQIGWNTKKRRRHDIGYRNCDQAWHELHFCLHQKRQNNLAFFLIAKTHLLGYSMSV